MKTKVQTFRNENYIVVYYSKDGKVLRYPTGIKVENPFDFSDKSWIKESVTGYQTLNKRIETIKGKIDNLISVYFQEYGVTPSVDFLKQQMNNVKQEIKKKDNTTFIDYFNNFLIWKKRIFDLNNKSISIKDYQSFKSVLVDYETFTGSPLMLKDVTNGFFISFVEYLKEPRISTTDKVYLTKGKMNQNTIRKRLKIFVTFFKYLKSENLVDTDKVEFVKQGVKSLNIKKEEIFKEIISVEEMKLIKQLSFKRRPYQIVKDLFYFSLCTGVNWGEIISIKKTDIQIHKEGWLLSKTRIKTNENYQVPLTDGCIEILKKYNFNLNLISSQRCNLYIKDILKEVEGFQTDVKKLKSDGTPFKRFEVIHFHSARHSFVTNLVRSNISVNEIMRYTGHKELQTLQMYISKETPIQYDSIKIFE